LPTERLEHSGWALEGLPADGPDPKLASKLSLFGQFVGDWQIVARGVPRVTESSFRQRGEVHFRWTLGGRAVQDVWGGVDPATARFIPAGTTVRFFDPQLDAWRSTWISPTQRAVRRFIGRRCGPEIVLYEENRGLRTERWIFSDIRPASFRWRAVRRRRLGGMWAPIEEMRLERQA
jgi:hypothetical protein